MADKMMYIPNDDTQNYPFCRLKSVGRSPICPTFEQDDSYMTSYKGKRKREGGEENLFKRDGRKGNRLAQKWDRLGFVVCI